MSDWQEKTSSLVADLANMDLRQCVEALNFIREKLHAISPFASEPVDFVKWVFAEDVEANDYNPNSVAPPEMELLRVSIAADGYTQPIVTNEEAGKRIVIDGFHRNRVGKECADVRARIYGYLPVVQIRTAQADRTDRIASTIRHNRARGKHRVEAMSDIVIELTKRNWSDEKISKNLGMEPDEILRLRQISGLAEMFQDQEFSKAWDIEGEITEADYVELTDDIEAYEESLIKETRTVNTSDEGRIFHPYHKWECHKAGFYKQSVNGMTKFECEEAYQKFLRNIPVFSEALEHVITEWKHSCEHYLTNVSMNRIAWLGQAAACYKLDIPSIYRGGFFLLSEDQQKAANECALTYLNKWLERNGRPTVTMEEAYSYDRQSDIY
jgi:ParB-like chromosome segregation protein Spo0J